MLQKNLRYVIVITGAVLYCIIYLGVFCVGYNVIDVISEGGVIFDIVMILKSFMIFNVYIVLRLGWYYGVLCGVKGRKREENVSTLYVVCLYKLYEVFNVLWASRLL